MKIFLFALLFGIISNAYFPTVFNVYYNYEYSLLKDYSQSYSEYHFRAEVVPYEQADVEIRMSKYDSYNNYFKAWIYEYDAYPSDTEINSGCPNGRRYTRINEYGEIYDDPEDNNYQILYFNYLNRDYSSTYLGIILTYTQTYYAYTYLGFKLNIAKYKFSNIKELNYNTHYSLDTKIFHNGIIPQYYQIYIRIAIHPDDKMEIQLEAKESYDKDNAFKVKVCQYVNKPDESQVYYNTGAKKCDDSLKNESNENKKYVYPFTTELEVNYLSICIINQITDRQLTYLDMYIYSETGMAIAVLVVIILIPCLIVIGVVGFLLKKFGCIGK